MQTSASAAADAPAKRQLSLRAQKWADKLTSSPLRDAFNKYFTNPYSPTNPGGIISLGVAENRAMWDHTVVRYSKPGTWVVAKSMLSYNVMWGVTNLRESIAQVWNAHMGAYGELLKPLTADNVTVQAGCSQSIDSIIQVLCDAGDGVMVPAPYYSGFDSDSTMEPQARLIPVPFAPPLFTFSIQACVEAYTAAVAKGVNVKVFLLCNPQNPLGRCYSREELESVMAFCGERGLELVVDEIYALSYFGDALPPTPDRTSTAGAPLPAIPLPPYIPIFSIRPPPTLPATSIHVLWGLSKDFGLNGLRMGAILSYSKDVLDGVHAVASQHNISVPVGVAVGKVLGDAEWVTAYLAESKKRLASMYGVMEAWLDGRGILHNKANAGFFVFVDLRKWVGMVGRWCGQEAFEIVEGEAVEAFGGEGGAVVKQGAPLDRSAELELFMKFIDGGVLTGMGGGFGCDQVGWFRIVYTSVDSAEDLKLALGRLDKVLTEVEVEYAARVAGRAWMPEMRQTAGRKAVVDGGRFYLP